MKIRNSKEMKNMSEKYHAHAIVVVVKYHCLRAILTGDTVDYP